MIVIGHPGPIGFAVAAPPAGVALHLDERRSRVERAQDLVAGILEIVFLDLVDAGRVRRAVAPMATNSNKLVKTHIV